MSRYDEYGLSKIKGTVSMTKVKNTLKHDHPQLVATLSNIRVNGQLRGCSGFITDPATGKHVYLNTEPGIRGEAYYRTAKDLKDFTGGRNHFCQPSQIVDKATELLTES